jgi:heat shock protein HslJ
MHRGVVALVVGMAAGSMASSACGPSAGAPSASLDGEWSVVLLSVVGREIELADHRVTLSIDGTSVTGTAACNSYGGVLDVDGAGAGTFELSDVAITEMACEPAVMEIESAVMQALMAIDRYQLTDSLSLDGGDDTRLELRRADSAE